VDVRTSHYLVTPGIFQPYDGSAASCSSIVRESRDAPWLQRRNGTAAAVRMNIGNHRRRVAKARCDGAIGREFALARRAVRRRNRVDFRWGSVGKERMDC